MIKRRFIENKKFIRCSDKDTIEKLKKLGFKLISESEGIATFVNDTTKPITFEQKKMAYTNTITF